MSDGFAGLPGAVTDESGLRHLGNPLGEQRALAQGTAIAPLGDRTVLAVTGEDRLSWLDSLTSQALTQLAPGESTELLVLDPHGHVEHAASVIDDGETAWLIVDRGDAEGLLAWLRRMRFRLRVEPRDASDEVAVIGGTTAALGGVSAFAPAGMPLMWIDPWPGISPGGYGYSAIDPTPGCRPGLGGGDRHPRGRAADVSCRRCGRDRRRRSRGRRRAAGRRVAPAVVRGGG